MITLAERSFLMSCIFNGFEFKQQHEALYDRSKEIVIDGVIMTMDRLLEIVQEVEKALNEKDKTVRFSDQFRYNAENYTFTDEIVEELRNNGIIFDRHGVFGVRLEGDKNDPAPLMQFLIEDDGTLYGDDFEIAYDWIDNVIEVLQDTKKYIADRKEEN